jgi:hypothetical protein
MTRDVVGAASVGSQRDPRLSALEAFARLLPPWMDDALCAQVGPELFFPEKQPGLNTTAEAKKICAQCSVRAKCLEYALEIESSRGYQSAPSGVYGGKSPRERVRLIRERDQAAS